MNSITEQKNLLRKASLQKRDAIPETTRIEMSLQACDHALSVPALNPNSITAGMVVAGFYPIRSEIDIRPLLFALAKYGARLCLPVVTSKTTIEFRELVKEAPLVSSGFGTIGPDEHAAVLDPQILLMPLSVYDQKGGRIGYGAGYYDRAIERLVGKGISPKLLGMAFSIQKAQTVPMEPHDRFLEAIITEIGTSSFKQK
ncbi:MAG: 5-formyltetrahydrofolate cyclo-ligase [Rhizobiaceae bacterium]